PRDLPPGGALRAAPAFVARAVGIAFDLQELRVTLAVLLGVRDDRAPDRAVRTQRVHFLRGADPGGLLNLDGLREVEAQRGRAQHARTGGAELHEVSSRYLGHSSVPPTKRERRWCHRSETAEASHEFHDARRHTMHTGVEIESAAPHEA